MEVTIRGASNNDQASNGQHVNLLRKDTWKPEEAKWLEDQYKMYENDIGRTKKFKTKKDLYFYLSREIEFALNVTKSQQQIANRVQTIYRQRKNSAKLLYSTADYVSNNNIPPSSFASGPSILRVAPMAGKSSGHIRPHFGSAVVRPLINSHLSNANFAVLSSTAAAPFSMARPSIVHVESIFGQSSGHSLTNVRPSNVVCSPSTSRGILQDIGENTSNVLQSSTGYSNIRRQTSIGDTNDDSGVTSMKVSLFARLDSGFSAKNITWHSGLPSTNVGYLPNSLDLNDTSSSHVSVYSDTEGNDSNYDLEITSTRNPSVERIANAFWTDEELLTYGGHSSNTIFRHRDAGASTSYDDNSHNTSKRLSHNDSNTSDTGSSTVVRQSTVRSTDIWTNAESTFLLDEYYVYIDEVGPLRTFRNKISLWQFLAREINKTFGCNKSWEQVESRYKTIVRKEKRSVESNRISGAVRTVVEFQDEIDKIVALDDSIEPEVLRGVNSVKYKDKKDEIAKKPRWTSKPTKKRILNTLSESFLAVEKRKIEREAKKEMRREDRHNATMEILRQLKKN